jgi:serine/threonine protein kinase
LGSLNAAMPASRKAPRQKPPRIPGYKISGVLGEGGMGRVYAGEQVKLGRRVAIKSFSLEGSQERTRPLYERFLAEARVLAQIEGHENIVQIYDLAEDDEGRDYIVMERVDGQTLDDAARQALSLAQKVRIIADAARALGHAHERGVIHRDVKPSNIMIARRGQVKIVDFGIARAAGAERKTRAGSAMGTPHYMSPEQYIDAKSIDARSDLYSLAVALYQIAAGRVPFDDDNPYALANRIQNDAPPPPSKFRADLDPRLEAIILRGMAKQPGERFQTAAEFEKALRDWLADAGFPPEALVWEEPANEPASPESLTEEDAASPALPITQPQTEDSASFLVDAQRIASLTTQPGASDAAPKPTPIAAGLSEDASAEIRAENQQPQKSRKKFYIFVLVMLVLSYFLMFHGTINVHVGPKP